MRNTRLILMMVAGLISTWYGSSLANQVVKSKVTAVTVYPDRAMITRTAEVRLSAGTNVLEFGDLPAGFVEQSLRVSGDAEAGVKILDVQIKTVYIDTIPDSRVANLQDKLAALKSREQVLVKKLGVLRTETAFIDSLRVYYARTAGKPTSKTPYVEWENALRFIEKNLDNVNGKSLDVNAQLKDVRGKISQVEDEIRRTQSYPQKMEKRAVVTLSSESAARAELHLSYLLRGAGWSPLYEERVNSGKNTIDIVYSGVVRQATGEDWNNVAVTLSTAQPSAGSVPPNLSPWYIGVYEPSQRVGGMMKKTMSDMVRPGSVSIIRKSAGSQRAGNTIIGTVVDQETDEPLIGASVLVQGTTYRASTDMRGRFTISGLRTGVYQVRATYVGYGSVASQNVVVNSSVIVRADFRLAALAIHPQAVVVAAEANRSPSAVSFGTAEVHESAASATFDISAPADIPGDNTPHKVTIATASLPATLSYTCVPKLSEGVYLTAKTKNGTDYPFLPGPANIFLDNSFVATSSIGNVSPGQEFSAYLGTDRSVEVKRKLINRFQESTGLLSKKTKITYSYVITIDNTKKVPIDLLVKGQVPVSGDERVAVEVLEPDPNVIKPDKQGFIEWHLNLKPAEKKELNLKFSVEYPSDLQVSGVR